VHLLCHVRGDLALSLVLFVQLPQLLMLCSGVSCSRRSEHLQCRLAARHVNATWKNWNKSVKNCGRMDDRCVKKSVSLEATASMRSADVLGWLLRVDLIKWVSNVRPPICTSVRPSVHKKILSFFNFYEIWCVGRGWRVMHGGMQYDPI